MRSLRTSACEKHASDGMRSTISCHSMPRSRRNRAASSPPRRKSEPLPAPQLTYKHSSSVSAQSQCASMRNPDVKSGATGGQQRPTAESRIASRIGA